MKDITEAFEEFRKETEPQLFNIEKDDNKIKMSYVDANRGLSGTELVEAINETDAYKISYAGIYTQADETLLGENWKRYGDNRNILVKDFRKDMQEIYEPDEDELDKKIVSLKGWTSVYSQAENALRYFYNVFNSKFEQKNQQE